MPTKIFDTVTSYSSPTETNINANPAELVCIDLDGIGADVSVAFPGSARTGQAIGITLTTGTGAHVVIGGGAVSGLPFPLSYQGDAALFTWDGTLATWQYFAQWHVAATGVTAAKRTFVNADLAAGVLTFNHNLNRNGLVWAVYDNTGTAVNPDLKLTWKETDANNGTLTLAAALLPIAGTWSIQVVGGP